MTAATDPSPVAHIARAKRVANSGESDVVGYWTEDPDPGGSGPTLDLTCKNCFM